MSFKHFFYAIIASIAILLGGAVAFNVVMNEFGLYGDMQGKELRIWGYERATKYLFSLNYIPANFEGVILGPSESDVMLDTRKLNAARIYNLSLNGGNICELKKLYDNVAERTKLKYLVIFMSPYILKECSMKTNEINPQVAQSALGSIFTLRFYGMKLEAMLHPETDPFREGWWGFRLNNAPETGYDHEKAMQSTADSGFHLDTEITPEAATALVEILSTAQAQNSRIIVVYPPIPRPLFDQIRDKYELYRQQTAKMLPDRCVTIDFNSEEYNALTGDMSNFHDPSHLNLRGAAMVLKAIDSRLH